MYEHEIAKGIAFLAENGIDVTDPNVVNVDGIQMERAEPQLHPHIGKCGCIIAQTCGMYSALCELGVEPWGREATDLGFLGHDEDDNFDTLSEEWKDAILAERAKRSAA